MKAFPGSEEGPPVTNETAITDALECMGSTVKGVSRGYVHASCPLAKHKHSGGVDNNPSFGVVYNSADAKKEEGHAHCFSCGYSGDIREIAGLLHVWGDLSVEDFANVMGLMEQVKTGALPLSLSQQSQDDPIIDPEWWNSFTPVSNATPAAVDYLIGRGILRET